MAIGSHKNTNRYFYSFILLCLLLGLSSVIVIFIPRYVYKPIYSSTSLTSKIIDRQDEWKYQNTITGEWYYWQTSQKNQHNDIVWRVKWLNTDPTSSLGVIVYLTTRNEINSLNISLAHLSLLLINNPRPVVIFHEGDFSDNDTQQSLAHTLGSRTPLAFERIQYSNNSTRLKPISKYHPLSYLNMCRFFTLMLPHHPLLSLFSFYWRLDSHSYIFGPKPIEDPFEIMQKRQIQYAFTMANEEGGGYVVGLWDLFQEFQKSQGLKASAAINQTQTSRSGGYSHAIIFTNFAIANVSLFRDHSLMRAWLHAVDHNGGIYRHRWGDAPIHTLALSQFVERDQIVRLRYFGYFHRREYVCASGTEGDLCKQQVQPFLTNPSTTYINYDDGCYPSSSKNPLCHYYPEIRE